ISARCYHARLHDLTKDNCRFVCEKDPDGLAIDTLYGKGFLAMNGVQTMSHACLNLRGEIPALAEAGVAAIRLSPQTCDLAGVAQIFRAAVKEESERPLLEEKLRALCRGFAFRNGFLHGREGAAFIESHAA